MPRAKTRKRPCIICRRWFLPDVRQKDRQKTCGREQCQQEHHRRLCKKWNDKNKDYYKANYLTEKLEQTKAPPNIPKSRIQLHLPRDVIIDRIGGQYLIIIEYVIEQIIRRNLNLSGYQPP